MEEPPPGIAGPVGGIGCSSNVLPLGTVPFGGAACDWKMPSVGALVPFGRFPGASNTLPPTSLATRAAVSV